MIFYSLLNFLESDLDSFHGGSIEHWMESRWGHGHKFVGEHADMHHLDGHHGDNGHYTNTGGGDHYGGDHLDGHYGGAGYGYGGGHHGHHLGLSGGTGLYHHEKNGHAHSEKGKSSNLYS